MLTIPKTDSMHFMPQRKKGRTHAPCADQKDIQRASQKQVNNGWPTCDTWNAMPSCLKTPCVWRLRKHPHNSHQLSSLCLCMSNLFETFSFATSERLASGSIKFIILINPARIVRFGTENDVLTWPSASTDKTIHTSIAMIVNIAFLGFSINVDWSHLCQTFIVDQCFCCWQIIINDLPLVCCELPASNVHSSTNIMSVSESFSHRHETN